MSTVPQPGADWITFDEFDRGPPLKKCMHSTFSGSAKQRRSLRRWHRKNNPTCNDTLMENLRLGRSCTG